MTKLLITLIFLAFNTTGHSQHSLVENPINESQTIVLDGKFVFFSPGKMEYSWDYETQGGAEIKAHRFLGYGVDGIYSFEYSLLNGRRYTVDYEGIGKKYIAKLASELDLTYEVLTKEVKYLDNGDITGYNIFFSLGGNKMFGNMFTGVKNEIRYLMIILHSNGANNKTTNLYFNLLHIK